MHIGVIVYSQTGNTYLVARKLKEKLDSAGHAASVEQVTVTGNASPGSKDFQLDTVPTVDRYEALVFGAPVQAFSLAPAMAAYLEQLPLLQDKKVACFVTKRLPFYWTGGRRVISMMRKICQSKGAAVCGSGIIIWSRSRRDRNIDSCIENLYRLLGSQRVNGQ